MEYIVMAAIIGLVIYAVFAYWIYITARRYGKTGNGRH
jgi:hypothetical protein